jgi:hypothetical protein
MRKILLALVRSCTRHRLIADRNDPNVPYLSREYIFGNPTSWGFLAVHFIHKSDSDAHLHTHPFNYLALQLSGTMYEVQPDGTHKRRPGYLRLRRRSSQHRLVLPFGEVVSLFLGFGRRGSWGFNVGGRIVDYKDYLK